MTLNPIIKEESALAKIARLEAPTYKNTLSVLELGGVVFTVWDIVKLALSKRLNIGLYGEQGNGKSQLFADSKSLYGNDAGEVYGRNDLDIKTLFRQLNFNRLVTAMNNGEEVREAELIEAAASVYKPVVLVEEINRCMEIVQNQFLSVFEGFIDLGTGKRYSLGGTKLHTFKDLDGQDITRNIRYSVGLWTANSGLRYTGTTSMDAALRGRTHLILDMDNFFPKGDDLDEVLYGSNGEARLKEQDNPENRTALFEQAYLDSIQDSYTPYISFLQEEMLLFRYLCQGLDYIPNETSENSKRKMKTWPIGAEEKNIGGTEEEIDRYRCVMPASVRGGIAMLTFARALRDYAKAKNPKAEVTVIDSVVESMKLMGAYTLLDNPQRITERFDGNAYLASKNIFKKLGKRLTDHKDIFDAIIICKDQQTPYTKNLEDSLVEDFACLR